jgi:hypothetical protein
VSEQQHSLPLCQWFCETFVVFQLRHYKDKIEELKEDIITCLLRGHLVEVSILNLEKLGLRSGAKRKEDRVINS